MALISLKEDMCGSRNDPNPEQMSEKIQYKNFTFIGNLDMENGQFRLWP